MKLLTISILSLNFAVSYVAATIEAKSGRPTFGRLESSTLIRGKVVLEEHVSPDIALNITADSNAPLGSVAYVKDASTRLLAKVMV